MTAPSQLATFGSGCFWCTEAVFKGVRGVSAVTTGYSGGTVANPSYEQVCSGTTGHAEVVQVAFAPAQVSYEQLVEIFFLTHDPTTRDRQGNDVGVQYRSVIFVHDEPQRATATTVSARLECEHVFARPIITTIEPFTAFYPASQEHQDYYAKNPDAAYCQVVIDPKIAKFRKRFAHLLKGGNATA